MSNLDLYVSPSLNFSGYYTPFEKAEFVVLGVPYDGTSTYRAGARFGPQAIREASLNIETYSLRSGLDVEDLAICDIGNLHVADNLSKTLERLTLVTSAILKASKFPVILGGEHSITLGAVRALGKATAILDFDAHMDLRDEYMGSKLSHTTFMRRLAEEIGAEKIVQVGVRAICKEDLNFAKKSGLKYIPAHEIRQSGPRQTAKILQKILRPYRKVYLTIDMDVLDPAFAPAVGNPEPDGISTTILLDILHEICDKRFLGFDLVEVAPHYDTGATSVQAAKIIFELLCFFKKTH